jgi:PAS domain S-box-containing protein
LVEPTGATVDKGRWTSRLAAASKLAFEVNVLGFKRIVFAVIALALLVAGLSVYLVFNQVATLGQDRAWVYHTRAVIETTQGLLTHLQDAEEGERGYLLTQDPSYLDSYRRAVAAIPSDEAHLQSLVAYSPSQTGQVRGLIGAIEDRRDIVDHTLQLAVAGDPDEARGLLRGGGGRVAMDDIRSRAASVIKVENEYLTLRTNEARRVESTTLVTGLAVSLLALATLTIGLVLLARANNRLNKAIAEARTAEAARESLSALTAAIFANVPDYLLVLNIEGDDRYVVADINPAFAKVLNTTAERVRGRAIDEMLPAPLATRLTNHYRRVRAASRPITTRDPIPQSAEGPRVWESILAPVANADGVVDRLIGSIRDITDRVRAEERLRDSQRMESIGQLTGGVAHDFNNLLQVIRGNLELLQTSVAGDERAQTRLKNAIFGAERAAQLTRQLLAFARRQPLAPKSVNLSRLVSDMADLLRRTLGEAIEVETVVAGGLWNTMADPAQVESALLNLALNARDAMPGGGRLTVEITNSVLDDSYSRGAGAQDVAPGQYVMLAVTDTGEGMSDEVRARVFEPFYTTKSEGKGTGLGLSMVYGFVKQSNGHIQIYSEVGQGTTLKIYLPRSRQLEEAAPPPPEQVARPTEGRTILVVEDEAAVREAALELLGELGYRRLEASDAASALAIVEKGERVDLVFTDVVMPGPIRTREFAQRLRELRPGLPVLFTSGYTDNAIIHQGRLDEGVQLISKPYAKADLARRIAQLLAEAAAEASGA